MKASPLFLLPLLLPLFGPHAPERRGVQTPAQQERQPQVDRLCPVITVECPDTVMPGAPVKFSAKVRGAGDAPSLTLTWTVSAGTIISGQTRHISTPDSIADIAVDTTGLTRGGTITATASVGGLARSCTAESSCTTSLLSPPPLEHYDEYGDIDLEDERARLDNYGVALLNDPAMSGYIVCYGGRRGRRGEAMARCERARKYLVGRRGFAPARIIPVDGGFRESLTVILWIMPPNMKPPVYPTVDPREVQFIEGPRKARGRAARRRRAGV